MLHIGRFGCKLEHMRIRYETGLATMAQLIIGTAMSFVGAAASIISGCRTESGADCVSNTFVSLVLVILTVCVYMCLLGLGYAAQERRSKRLAKLLILAEAVVALFYLFDTRHAPTYADRFTNFIAFATAAWVMVVAIRLLRAGRRRIVRRRQSAVKP